MNRRKFLGLVAGLVASISGKLPFAPKPPPYEDTHHEDLENAVVGSILLDPAMANAVFSVIDDHRWITRANTGLVFVEIRIMRKRGMTPSLEAVHDFMKNDGLLDAAGGYRHLVKLAESVPNPKNARLYAQSLIELGKQRPTVGPPRLAQS